MLPKHQDCSGCCAQGRCHFCLRPGQYEFRDGVNSFASCASHLLWLATAEYAPGADSDLRGRVLDLPVEEIKSSARAEHGRGERIFTQLGSLEPPAILR